ncbi:Transcriptional regulator of acetoin/glycerol metabolism [Thermosyntropha lipolytica DSM 11003]|uniref:Transcriptional regulator of acetoin/glycerol metabolism n=1 Tax=Thermosyntropha lipolytica DSM 11003 TaxID=1123382 RepID=A0A1M5MP06_9FIRM|nr:sigma-54-dependent Fis family transcriptional regulator [Thermosyntropha lipolytica]SHG79038.1 Transcriptional regulator of acetoin/glycerol metabolism [Thermosyntropha lipolytica DSM 11003]
MEEVRKAWENFILTGQLDVAKVRKEIGESWLRCYKNKVDPVSEHTLPLISREKIESIKKKKAGLLKLAVPLMQKLYALVAGSGFIVVLTDENGYILEALGDSDIISKIDELLVPGTCWAEEFAGTNAIGTVIKMGKPLQVSGPEHYCSFLHGWTCSGAPIRGENGELIGVLDISGPSALTHIHTLGMVVATAEAIMSNMRIEKKNWELKVVNKQMQDVFINMSDGVIFLERDGRIGHANPAAEKIFKKGSSALKGSFIGDLITFPREVADALEKGEMREHSDIEVTVKNSHEDINCIASTIMVRNEKGEITGTLMIINPVKRIKKLVNRFSGAHATFSFEDIIGKDPRFLEAVKIARMAANTNSNILLQGESGTGKELFAQAIHNASSRCNEPFIAVNCGAIPRELLGSELFGYVEGAFTGACKGGRPGKFELASGGTLFLDEIGEMPLGKQVALLRAIQEKEITRLGDDKVIPVDVRIICATNKDLYQEVMKGNFRQDLYYRLNVISIILPPLRERIADIPLLFYHFLEDMSKKIGIKVPEVDKEVFAYLSSYSWPGNVRELHNVVERILNITGGERITVSHLPEEITGFPLERKIGKTMGTLYDLKPMLSVEQERQRHKRNREGEEYRVLLSLLAKHGGNITRVAQEMQVSRNTVYRKLKKYGILL